MRVFGLFVLIFAFLAGGCSDNSTDPAPVVETKVAVTGDISESYNAVAYFTPATFENDTTRNYFLILLLPRISGDNVLAGAWLYKSGDGLPDVKNYQIGEYAFGEDIPASDFGGSYSGLDAVDFSGYSMTEGQLSIKSASESRVTGEFSMSGYWRFGLDADSTRVITVTGKFSAAPAPDEG